MIKQNVIIFGCGAEGKYSFAKINNTFHVTAFCDNNSALWGSKLFGLSIIPPEELPNHQDATVIVCVSQGFIDIAKQLDAMGVPCVIDRRGLFYAYRDTILYPVNFGGTEVYKKAAKTAESGFSVLFVQEAPCGRTDKISCSLKQLGVTTHNAYFRNPSKMPQAYHKENVFYSYDDLLAFVNGSDFDIIHCSNEPDILANLLLHSNKPVVADSHDLLTARHNDSSPEVYYFEYAANKFADGNLYVGEYYRDLQAGRYGFSIDKTLIIPNLPLESQLPENARRKPKQSAADGELHIVYEGGISDNPASHRFFENLWSVITASHVHIHYYSQQNISYCQALEKTSPYLHYEGNLSGLELITEMTQYDAGSLLLNPVDKNADMAHPNKLYEYLAAGLPVVSNLTEPLRFLKLRGVGGGLNLDADIKTQLLKYAAIEIPADYLRTNKLTMDSYANEILVFYKKISEKGKTVNR